MPDNNPQDQSPVYSSQGNLAAKEFLDIARIHHREAKQLFEGAQQAQAEGRQEEAKLLTDLAIARRERAEEFERVAKGEGSDPIVTEILDYQDDMCKNYTPYAPPYSAPEKELPQSWIDEMKPPPLGPIARAVAWIGSWITP
jgi:hypothetical protein